jgi:hypothetical protein
VAGALDEVEGTGLLGGLVYVLGAVVDPLADAAYTTGELVADEGGCAEWLP